MSILDKIIEEKYNVVASQKALVSIKALEKKIGFTRPVISMKKALSSNESLGIIAEFKRKSPSKGIINNKVRVEDVTTGFSSAGATGLSVLTDLAFFGGSAVDLIAARETNTIPILRKDFIIDEYQVFESKAMGADVILLIAAILELYEIKNLARCAKSLGLEILFEIHSVEELDKIVDEVDMVGINNRNLKDFKVDIQNSLNIANHIPGNFVKVSESGLDNPETIKRFRENGFKGFLIGEAFMKHPDPGEACKEFIDKLQTN